VEKAFPLASVKVMVSSVSSSVFEESPTALKEWSKKVSPVFTWYLSGKTLLLSLVKETLKLA